MAIFSSFILSRRVATLSTGIDEDLLVLSNRKSSEFKESLELNLKKFEDKIAEENSSYQRKISVIDARLEELRLTHLEAEQKLQSITKESEKLLKVCQENSKFWAVISDKFANIPALEEYLTELLDRVQSTWITSSLGLLEKFLIIQDNLRNFTKNPVFTSENAPAAITEIIEQVLSLIGSEGNDDTFIGILKAKFSLTSKFLDWTTAKKGRHHATESVILIMSADPFSTVSSDPKAGEYISSIVRAFEMHVPTQVLLQRDAFSDIIRRDISGEFKKFIVEIGKAMDSLASIDLTTLRLPEGPFIKVTEADNIFSNMATSMDLESISNIFFSERLDSQGRLLIDDDGFSVSSEESESLDAKALFYKNNPSATVPVEISFSPRRVKPCCPDHHSGHYQQGAFVDGYCVRRNDLRRETIAGDFKPAALGRSRTLSGSSRDTRRDSSGSQQSIIGSPRGSPRRDSNVLVSPLSASSRRVSMFVGDRQQESYFGRLYQCGGGYDIENDPFAIIGSQSRDYGTPTANSKTMWSPRNK